MTKNAVELLEAALALSEAERAELAEVLAESVRSGSGCLHPAWESELRRRAEELDSGRFGGFRWPRRCRLSERNSRQVGREPDYWRGRAGP